jgi:hypothetical protein
MGEMRRRLDIFILYISIVEIKICIYYFGNKTKRDLSACNKNADMIFNRKNIARTCSLWELN